MTPTERPLALAVVAVFDDEIPCGYGTKPTAAGWQDSSPSIASTFTGYVVLWPGQTLPATEQPVNAYDDADQSFQLTYVGKTAEQADALRDRGRALLTSDSVQVDGDRAVYDVRFRDAQQIRADNEVTPPLFYAVDRFTARTA